MISGAGSPTDFPKNLLGGYDMATMDKKELEIQDEMLDQVSGGILAKGAEVDKQALLICSKCPGNSVMMIRGVDGYTCPVCGNKVSDAQTNLL